jgi:thiamine kinase-like enzyme
MERGPSPLELLHPDGIARYVSVIGNGCPDVLKPERPMPRAGEHADLVIVAPTRAELGDRTWPQGAVEKAAGVLAADGVVYVLSPPRWRRRFSRLLAERDLGLKVSLAHDPDAKDLRCLVPLSPEVATYAYTNLIATRPGRRRLLLRALRVGWLARLVARTLPAAGFAAGAPTSRPLFAWLFAATDADVRAPLAVLSVSWRGSKGSLVAHGFEDGAALPSVVAKVRGSGTPAADDEAAVIRRLGPAARAAGAAVPEPLLVETGENRTVLFETPVEGRTAAAILGETPALVASVTTRLTEWLENWNLDTRSDEELSAEWLELAIAGPARALLPGEDRYLQWLDSRCRSLAGTTVAFVATHNDLTMVNVFVAQSGALGVVDWEAARERDLPLVDFYYGAADAAAAGTRYADRPAAFREQFEESARAGSLARQLEARLTRTLDLSPAAVELAFHACWIRHALTEQRTSEDPAPRPFLEILRSVANAAR